MKKNYLLILALLCFLQVSAQTLNQSAGWPNTNWTITGTYSPAVGAFESNPTTTANFAFDDDDAGNPSDDSIAAESPVINLTAAFNAGETGILVSVQYGYYFLNDDVLQFEYWNAVTSTWNLWGGLIPGNDEDIIDNFCTIPKINFTTPTLNIAGFTPTQLAGFKYRIYYNDQLDGGAWNYGFCFESPVISSVSCITPTNLAVNVNPNTSASLSWTAGGSETLWDIEVVNVSAGGTPTGTPTATGVTNPYIASPLLANTDYAFYVRSNCGGVGASNWSEAFLFNTTLVPGCASNLTPANGATNVPVGNVVFSWTTPTTGEAVVSYNLYYGLTPGNANIFVGNYLTTSANINLSGFNATFYWLIEPVNAGGSPLGCSEWNFTTVPAPGYCLNSPNNEWPVGAQTPAICDGLTVNNIVLNGYAGEYSTINVTSGQTYKFSSSIATDLVTISADGGLTAAAFGTTPVTWVSTLTGTIRFYTHVSNQCGAEAVNRIRSIICGVPATTSPDYVSLQFPASATIVEGGSTTVYGQVYEGGLTDVAPNIEGQAPGITAWVGISPIGANTNPNTWTTWIEATWNAGSIGNNDEYQATIGATLVPGTYYYATRFSLTGGAFVYGGTDGTNGNFWNGTTHNSGVLTVTAPPAPANDVCSTPITLTVGGVFLDNDIDSTNFGATLSAETPAPTCGIFGFATAGKDVWYSVVVPASGSVTIETSVTNAAGEGLDTIINAYSGSCTGLMQINCDDDGSDENEFGLSLLSLTAQAPGSTILVRVFGYDGEQGSYSISAYDASLATNSFDNANFSYYPNPVKNTLNLSYNKDISNVAVFNILGQEVLVKSVNASQGEIDLSNLTGGTYFVKVTADNQVKTIKIIKE